MRLGKRDELVVVAALVAITVAVAVTIAGEKSRLDQVIEIIVALPLVSHSSSRLLLVIRCLLASNSPLRITSTCDG